MGVLVSVGAGPRNPHHRIRVSRCGLPPRKALLGPAALSEGRGDFASAGSCRAARRQSSRHICVCRAERQAQHLQQPGAPRSSLPPAATRAGGLRVAPAKPGPSPEAQR